MEGEKEVLDYECVVCTHCAVIVRTTQVNDAMSRLKDARIEVLSVKPHSYRGSGSTFILVNTMDEKVVRAAMGEAASVAVDETSECQEADTDDDV